jgi:hypothetical protein
MLSSCANLIFPLVTPKACQNPNVLASFCFCPTYQKTKIMELYQRPECYIGPEWNGWYIFLSQNRDSDFVDRSNFEVAWEQLNELNIVHDECTNYDIDCHFKDTVYTVRDRHWLCGWLEWIAIHQSNIQAYQLALDMESQLSRYPVLNEDHLSNLEWEEGVDEDVDCGCTEHEVA